MNNFLTRVISAVIAVMLAILAGYFWGPPGLVALVTVCITLLLREYDRIAAGLSTSLNLIRIWFLLASILLYGGFVFSSAPGLLILSTTLVLYYSGTLWLARNVVPNTQILNALTLGSLGLLYCMTFPCLIIKTLLLPNGIQWFALHLTVVFAGDTFAYFGGTWFGRAKLMPALSPNKTFAGAFSGLAGSAMMGVLFANSYLIQAPPAYVLIFSILCGFAGQMGDLFVSLLKRVAHVKDSGSLMPGHGGILDRVDGVLMTAPLIYGFALYIESGL